MYDIEADPVATSLHNQIDAAHETQVRIAMRMHDLAEEYFGQEEFPVTVHQEMEELPAELQATEAAPQCAECTENMDCAAADSEPSGPQDTGDALSAREREAAHARGEAAAKKLESMQQSANANAMAKARELAAARDKAAAAEKRVEAVQAAPADDGSKEVAQLQAELAEAKAANPTVAQEEKEALLRERVDELIEDMEEGLSEEERAKRKELRERRLQAVKNQRIAAQLERNIKGMEDRGDVPFKWVEQLAAIRGQESAKYKEYVEGGVEGLMPVNEGSNMDKLVDSMSKFPVQMLYERLDRRGVGVVKDDQILMSLSSSDDEGNRTRRLWPLKHINAAVMSAQRLRLRSGPFTSSASTSTSAMNRAQRALGLPANEERELRTAQRLGLVTKDKDGNYQNAKGISVIDSLFGDIEQEVAEGEAPVAIADLRAQLSRSSESFSLDSASSAEDSSSSSADETEDAAVTSAAERSSKAAQRKRGNTGKYAALRSQLVAAFYEAQRGERSRMRSHMERQMRQHMNVQRMRMRMTLSAPSLNGDGEEPLLMRWQTNAAPAGGSKKVEMKTAMQETFYANPVQGLSMVTGGMTVRQGREMAARMHESVNEKARVYGELHKFAYSLENTDKVLQGALGRKYQSDEDRARSASRSPSPRRRRGHGWTRRKGSSSSGSSSSSSGGRVSRRTSLQQAREACERNLVRMRNFLIKLSEQHRRTEVKARQLNRALRHAVPLLPAAHPQGDVGEFSDDPAWMCTMDEQLYSMAYDFRSVKDEFETLDKEERAKAVRAAATFYREVMAGKSVMDGTNMSHLSGAGNYLTSDLVLAKGDNAKDYSKPTATAATIEAALKGADGASPAHAAASLVLFAHHHPTRKGPIYNTLRAWAAQAEMNLEPLTAIQVSVTTIMQAYRQLAERERKELEELGDALPRALVALYDYWQEQLSQIHQMLMIMRMMQRYALLNAWQQREQIMTGKARLHRLLRKHLRSIQRRFIVGPTSPEVLMMLLAKIGQESLSRASSVSVAESMAASELDLDIAESRSQMRRNPSSAASYIVGSSQELQSIPDIGNGTAQKARSAVERAIIVRDLTDISTAVNILSRGQSLARLHSVFHPDLKSIQERADKRAAEKAESEAAAILDSRLRTRSSSRGSASESGVTARVPKDLRVHGDGDALVQDGAGKFVDGTRSLVEGAEARFGSGLDALIAEQNRLDKEKAQDMGQDMVRALEEVLKQENEELRKMRKERGEMEAGSEARNAKDLEITKVQTNIEDHRKGLDVLRNAVGVSRLLQNIRWGYGRRPEFFTNAQGVDMFQWRSITHPSPWLALECMRAILTAAKAGVDVSQPENVVWAIDKGPSALRPIGEDGARAGAVVSSPSHKWVLMGGPEVEDAVLNLTEEKHLNREHSTSEDEFMQHMRPLLNAIKPLAA